MRGKYILVDFWASWCIPCRKEAPYLREAYKKFRNKGQGFDIFSISLDNDRNAWTQAIKQDEMNWTNGSDLLGFNSASASTYLVTAIPANFLIDPEGRIIAKNLRGEDVVKKLNELIK